MIILIKFKKFMKIISKFKLLLIILITNFSCFSFAKSKLLKYKNWVINVSHETVIMFSKLKIGIK